MKKDIATLKKHLDDLQTSKRKMQEQDVMSSIHFMEKVGDLLNKHGNPEYEQQAERLLKSYNMTSDLTKKLSTNIDKWIADLEYEIKSLENK